MFCKGTTWLQEIVFLVLNDCNTDKAQENTIEWRVPFFEYETPGLKYVESLPTDKPRILKTHLPKQFLPDDIENKSKVRPSAFLTLFELSTSCSALALQVVYIARNPKDVVVSYFQFVKMSTQAGFSEDFKAFADLFLEGKGEIRPRALLVQRLQPSFGLSSAVWAVVDSR